MTGPSYKILITCVLLQCSMIAPFVAATGGEAMNPLNDWVDMDRLLQDRGEDSPASFSEARETFSRRKRPTHSINLGERHPMRQYNVANQVDMAGSIDPRRLDMNVDPDFPMLTISKPGAYHDTPIYDTDEYLAEAADPQDLMGAWGGDSRNSPSSFADSAMSDGDSFSQDASPFSTYDDDLFAQENFFSDDDASSRQNAPSSPAVSPVATRASKRPKYYKKKIAAPSEWACPYYGTPLHDSCQQYFKSRANLRRHTLLEDVRSGKTTRDGKAIKNIFKCASCDMLWLKESLLHAHEKGCGKTHQGQLSCDYCPAAQMTEDELLQHKSNSACKRKRLSQDLQLQALI